MHCNQPSLLNFSRAPLKNMGRHSYSELTLQSQNRTVTTVDVPVYTIGNTCVNSAFDLVYHKID